MEFFRAMTVFIEQPFLAFALSLVFVFLYVVSKSRIALSAALLWLIYCPYEYAMKVRILCSGECNIRVDLLLIYPILILVSLAGVIMYATIVLRKRRA